MVITVGVLALQGGVIEHISLLHQAAAQLQQEQRSQGAPTSKNEIEIIQVRKSEQLARCDALVIPGGESTTMAIVAARLGLLEELRKFVRIERKPVWGTCAGLVLLAAEASATKKGGQELIGGLDVRVLRNCYGTQKQSFVADLDLPFLGKEKGDTAHPFRAVFIRAPVVEEILAKNDNETPSETVETLGVFRKTGASNEAVEAEVTEDIVAVRQGNVFGTSFHPELTGDSRIHMWWLQQVVERLGKEGARAT